LHWHPIDDAVSLASINLNPRPQAKFLTSFSIPFFELFGAASSTITNHESSFFVTFLFDNIEDKGSMQLLAD